MINLKYKRVINKPIAQVWDIIYKEFPTIEKWATGVYTSRGPKGNEKFDRMCVVSFGKINEYFVKVDEKNYHFTFSVTGMPFFVKKVRSTWSLRKLSPNKTEITFNPRLTTKGIIGMIMEIPLKYQFQKLVVQVGKDIAVYAETGRLSSAKRKENNKRKK